MFPQIKHSSLTCRCHFCSISLVLAVTPDSTNWQGQHDLNQQLILKIQCVVLMSTSFLQRDRRWLTSLTGDTSIIQGLYRWRTRSMTSTIAGRVVGGQLQRRLECSGYIWGFQILYSISGLFCADIFKNCISFRILPKNYYVLID